MVVVSCGSSNCFLGIEVQAHLFESQKTRWSELNSLFHTSDCHVNIRMVEYEDCQLSRKQASLCSVLITWIWVSSPTIQICANPIFSNKNFIQNKSAPAFHHHILLSSSNRATTILNWYNQRLALSKKELQQVMTSITLPQAGWYPNHGRRSLL